MLWFTSDTHFLHENIINFCDRPYKDTSHMSEGIIDIWNKYVKPDDIVYHLGDYAFKAFSKKDEIREITSRLNGFKILVLGNHDYKEVAPYFGLDLIVPSAYIRLKGIDFKLTHYPYVDGMTANDKVSRPECFTNLEYNKKTKEAYPLINGHVHDEWAVKAKCLNVGWDIWKRPISEEEIIAIYTSTGGFEDEKIKAIFS